MQENNQQQNQKSVPPQNNVPSNVPSSNFNFLGKFENELPFVVNSSMKMDSSQNLQPKEFTIFSLPNNGAPPSTTLPSSSLPNSPLSSNGNMNTLGMKPSQQPLSSSSLQPFHQVMNFQPPPPSSFLFSSPPPNNNLLLVSESNYFQQQSPTFQSNTQFISSGNNFSQGPQQISLSQRSQQLPFNQGPQQPSFNQGPQQISLNQGHQQLPFNQGSQQPSFSPAYLSSSSTSLFPSSSNSRLQNSPNSKLPSNLPSASPSLSSTPVKNKKEKPPKPEKPKKEKPKKEKVVKEKAKFSPTPRSSGRTRKTPSKYGSFLCDEDEKEQSEDMDMEIKQIEEIGEDDSDEDPSWLVQDGVEPKSKRGRPPLLIDPLYHKAKRQKMSHPDDSADELIFSPMNSNLPQTVIVSPSTQSTKSSNLREPLSPNFLESGEEYKLLHLIRRCESYSERIREIIRTWQEKSNRIKRLRNPQTTKEILNQGNLVPSNSTPLSPSSLPTATEMIQQPSNLTNKIRPYQLIGLNWLYLLFQQKINGILADEMGLGKTIQTISLFALLKERKEIKNVHLVVVPASALENWVRECATWCPSLKVCMYHGSQKEREDLRQALLPAISNYDVIVSTYHLVGNKTDRKLFFKKLDFGYIVLDEAHNIKNAASVRYNYLIKLAQRSQHRLMLTGTPLQNNVNELWALLNFLMPKIFGNANFSELLKGDTEGEESKLEEIKRLKTILSPFMLRRLKSEVLGNLPEKSEKIIWCELTPVQEEIYMKTYQSSKTKFHSIRDQGVNQVNSNEPLDSVSTLNFILMQLRKAANNRLLFRDYYTDEKIQEIESFLNQDKDIKKSSDEIPPNEHSPIQDVMTEQPADLLKESVKEDPEIQEEEEEEGEESAEEPESEDYEQEEVEEEPKKKRGRKPKNPAPNKPMTRGESRKRATRNSKAEDANEPKGEEVTTSGTHEDDECAICGKEGDLLCCDGKCLQVFHPQCLQLDHLPDGKWYCPECIRCQNETPEKSPHYDKFLSICKSLEQKQVSGRKVAWLFRHPPPFSLYPDYYQVIEHPTSIFRIKNTYHESPEAFCAEFLILFNNAKRYNDPSSVVYKDAVFLERLFIQELQKKFPEIDLKGLKKDLKKIAKSKTPKQKVESSEPKLTRGRKKKMEQISHPPSDKDDNKELRRSSRKRKVRYLLLNNNESIIDNFDEEEEEEEEEEELQEQSKSSRKKRGQLSSPDNLIEPFASCYQLLEELMEHEDAPPFNEPVDVEGLELVGYREIVKHPMDLGTIKSKLLNSKYSSVEAFVADVKLVFENCILYNESASEIGVGAQVLWSFFKKSSHRYKIKIKEEQKSLKTGAGQKNLFEELKLKPDIEIHSFCKKRNLTQFLLTKDQILSSSGKLTILKDLLEMLSKNQHRVLIFSQFTKVLTILEEFLSCLNYKYLRLDGSTPVLERQLLIDTYNSNRDVFIFLLSTRAAGLGINLTSADTCIFHDVDWNPEIDRQAEARCHRIGQYKPVTIYKVLMSHSIDEYIFKLAESKKERNNQIVEHEKSTKSGSVQELQIGQILASLFAEHSSQSPSNPVDKKLPLQKPPPSSPSSFSSVQHLSTGLKSSSVSIPLPPHLINPVHPGFPPNLSTNPRSSVLEIPFLLTTGNDTSYDASFPDWSANKAAPPPTLNESNPKKD